MIGIFRKSLGLVLRAYTWLALAVILALGYFGFIRYTPQGGGALLGGGGGDASVVVADALAQIVAALPEPETPQSLLVLPFEGDRSDEQFRESLARAIRESGKFETVDKTFTERAMEAVNLTWGSKASPERDEALRAAKRARADAVLVGRLTTFRQGDAPEIALEWEAIDTSGGDELAGGAIDVALEEAAARAPRGLLSRGKDAGWALLIWVGLALSVPLFLAGLLSNFLAKESNLTNLGLLGALTLLNVVLAFWLLGFGVAGLLDSLLLIAAGIAGGAYNYLLLDKLEELRQTA